MNDTDNCGRTGEHLRFHWKYQSVMLPSGSLQPIYRKPCMYLFPQKCGMEFQQKSVLFSLPQQEQMRFPSFLHTPVSGTIAASDNSFVRETVSSFV